MTRIGIVLSALVLAAACSVKVEPGVSRQLAQERSERISNVTYELYFSIPEEPEAACSGAVTIAFDLKGRGPVQLDFRSGMMQSISGPSKTPEIRDEHIVLKGLKEGQNTVTIGFTPEDAPLNRHKDYLYTLLVPERARTLFPCFDQPDLKAVFSLTLDIPEQWTAMSNAPAESQKIENGRKELHFADSDLISTYLFAFVAGRWEEAAFPDGIRILYRESDPAKLAQLPEIHRQIRFALDWMEDFTAIPMPFQKYECAIVPGFQFGGMEHPGCILYNDRRMFLSANPTDAEQLSRTDLIAHETAHMWFGDAVTMRWFDDVWTKEVFANHFSAWMTRPLYPEMDFRLRDFRSFNLPAYAEDRTALSNPIRQQLDNLQDAGLVYGNIVYDKAPVVMRMLADTLGTDAFREGMREYLSTYLGGNATWPELIDILDNYTSADLKRWSHRWVEESGMPEYPETDGLPNLDALGYGYYPMTPAALEKALSCVVSLPEACARLSTLANLYENMLHGRVEPLRLADCIGNLLQVENNPLVAASALSYLADIWSVAGQPVSIEVRLLALSHDQALPEQIRLQAFRSLMHVFKRQETAEELYAIWSERASELALSEDDYTTLALELAVRLPERYERLRSSQRNRIDNADRRARFDFIFPSIHPSKAVRDKVFASLLEPENRVTEPWVLESLRFLNHPLRQDEAIGYIIPGLDEVCEIQRTGDIFFPKNWAVALLSGHRSPEAAALVRDWLAANPSYPPLLLNKILQAADPLLRQ